jgi:hypothetical protein
MNLPDKLIVAMLIRDPEKCERLLRKHKPIKNECRQCHIVATPETPCRPLRLARVAAFRMEQANKCSSRMDSKDPGAS